MKTNACTRLPVHPRPNPQEESLSNYCLRVSEANGFDSPRKMLAGLGVYVKEHVGASAIKKLSPSVDVDTGVLEKMAYLALSSGPTATWKRGQHVYEPNDISMRITRICPECIRELGHTRALWDIRLVVACPRHRTLLLSSCPKCAEPLTWARKGLLTCSCGYQLGESARVPVNESSIRIASLIEHALYDSRHVNIDFSWCPQEIREMPFNELHNFLTYWPAKFSSQMNLSSMRSLRRSLDAAEQTPMLDVIARAVAEWPLSHARMIAKEFESTCLFGNHICEIDFRNVIGHSWIPRRSENSGFLSNEIRKYLTERATYQNEHTTLYLNPRYIVPFTASASIMRGVGAVQGAALLGIGEKLFLQLAKRGVFKNLEKVPPDSCMAIFDIDSILSIKPQISTTFDYLDAAEKLAVNKAQLSSLVEHGVLKVAIGKNKTAVDARFRIVDLTALNSRFADLSQTTEGRSGSHRIQVRSFWPKRPYVSKTRAFGLLVQAILNAEIKIALPQTEIQGIGDYLVDASDLELAGFSICTEWLSSTPHWDQPSGDRSISGVTAFSRT